MSTNKNEFTKQDRACINCKHCMRRYNPVALISLLMGNNSGFYRCTFGGIKEEMDPVTGRIFRTVRSYPATYARQQQCGTDSGRNWEPSQKFLAQKQNLLKALNYAGPK